MKPLDYVNHIERMEIELTRLNASRSLVPVKRQLEVKTVGTVTLLRDSTDPASVYYNRIKGFGPQMLAELDELLSYYAGDAPCFDMSPDHMTEEVARALCKKGFFPAEQLVFMVINPPLDGLETPAFQFERVTEETAEEFIEWIGKSAGGMKITREMIARSKAYFYRADFMNYMLRLDGEPAAMGSLFLHGAEGYLANDYTFPAYRGKGCQSSLIKHRLAEAARLGLKAVYTDVEFGSASHANMERVGFRTAFLNTYWMAE
ncbi:GNAT family N-acetyltransferase [Paenibacillus tianjinensis]|uniref:GNAT family N-acetyltransferase n=1 Tax=Paenibacillus tianjinensis TaxID=2810347 RepID=A0ABX7LCN1_9BACL|nr:GNAT family N-acetyltransferase [Paenibacillus tianjinensis]QSF45016.1 GNAT family N-acetyltransferase [Paenibacillus tianjinensis]